MTDDVEVTVLLRAWAADHAESGRPPRTDRYQHLRRRAAAYVRGDRRNHTLQPTALVHEADPYIRVQARRDRKSCCNRHRIGNARSEGDWMKIVQSALRTRVWASPFEQAA